MLTARNVLALLSVSAILIACVKNADVSGDMEKSSDAAPTMMTGPALPPAEFSAPKAGTKLQWKNTSTNFTWTNTYRETTEPFNISIFSETGDIRNLYLFCKYCGSPPNTISVEDYAKLFPLQVGKKVKIQRKHVGSSDSWTHKIAVIGTELVDVPFSASPLPTYVIEENIWKNHSAWKGKVTYWYAPSLGADVKIVDNASNDMKTEKNMALINYKSP